VGADPKRAGIEHQVAVGLNVDELTLTAGSFLGERDTG
jgi:hypothetical protein